MSPATALRGQHGEASLWLVAGESQPRSGHAGPGPGETWFLSRRERCHLPLVGGSPRPKRQGGQRTGRNRRSLHDAVPGYWSVFNRLLLCGVGIVRAQSEVLRPSRDAIRTAPLPAVWLESERPARFEGRQDSELLLGSGRDGAVLPKPHILRLRLSVEFGSRKRRSVRRVTLAGPEAGGGGC